MQLPGPIKEGIQAQEEQEAAAAVQGSKGKPEGEKEVVKLEIENDKGNSENQKPKLSELDIYCQVIPLMEFKRVRVR